MSRASRKCFEQHTNS